MYYTKIVSFGDIFWLNLKDCSSLWVIKITVVFRVTYFENWSLIPFVRCSILICTLLYRRICMCYSLMSWRIQTNITRHVEDRGDVFFMKHGPNSRVYTHTYVYTPFMGVSILQLIGVLQIHTYLHTYVFCRCMYVCMCVWFLWFQYDNRMAFVRHIVLLLHRNRFKLRNFS